MRRPPPSTREAATATATAWLAVTVLFATVVAHAAPATPEPAPMTPHALQIVTTSPAPGQRLSPQPPVVLHAATQPVESEVSVLVSTATRDQTMLGIGGAITDATAEVFARLSPARQSELLRAYYDPVDGIGYTLARTTIHSSDFSSASYTYIDEGDGSLRTFSIAHDRVARLPMVKRAIAAAGGHLTLFASPWSAPAFMKDNGSLVKGGRLKPEFAAAWARYLTLFVRAWEAEGVPIWGLTVQNEPMATQRWESMIFTAEEERDFLKHHLGPAMQAAGYGDRKLIVWDHNRDLMAQRARVIFSDPEAARYAWGLGFHWYETWAGGRPMFDNVGAVHRAWPDKHLLLTEATVEAFDPARLQDWSNAERYGTALVNDLNQGAEGWTDWNLLLDLQGGPNHVGNFCFAPVHADLAHDALVFTPSFFYLGHFSKFIRPGARRVDATSSRSTLATTAWLNVDGTLAAVVMNASDTPVTYRFQVDGEEAVLTIPAHGIQTLRR